MALGNSRTEMGRKPEAGSKQLKQAGHKLEASRQEEFSKQTASEKQQGRKHAARRQQEGSKHPENKQMNISW